MDAGVTLPQVMVIGRDGLIGRALWQRLQPGSIGTTRRSKAEPWYLDITQPAIQSWDLNGYHYALIAAASPRIGWCEQEPQLSYQINVTGPLLLAQQLLAKGVTPVFFSTDYVFDGHTGGYTEQSPVSPVNVYGRQKAELEQRIPEICGSNYLLIRLSKVFDIHKGDGTLLDEMIRMLLTGQLFRAATDQYFCPLWVKDLVDIVFELLKQQVGGLINVGSPEVWQRYDLACQVARMLKVSTERVQPIVLADLNEAFPRPGKTWLDCQALWLRYSPPVTSVTDCLARLVAQYQGDSLKDDTRESPGDILPKPWSSY